MEKTVSKTTSMYRPPDKQLDEKSDIWQIAYIVYLACNMGQPVFSKRGMVLTPENYAELNFKTIN